ncbi:hypothetical protein AAFC00_007163 [Neodothiora populina]|uniref:Uncharacterized protein n=1 Tax=Neodothiora populina TaxID=2781224 RepID=A0ABR3PII9_9PEZI
MSAQAATLRGCPLLELPLELRLIIYDYAIVESSSVTISSAELTGDCVDIDNRLYGQGRSPIPGLPENHEPVILSAYSSHLLSAADPPRIHVSRAPAAEGLRYLDPAWQSTLSALRLVNHQIIDELSAHFRSKRSRETSLFVSYPHGLHVFQTLCPETIRQARSVHIAGTYTRRPHRRRNGQQATTAQVLTPPPSPRADGSVDMAEEDSKTTEPDSVEQLASLVRSTMGQEATTRLAKLELRIYFPNSRTGEDSYYSVWGDDDSPICVVLRNLCGGFIDMECWRGKNGTGVHLSVRPNPDNSRIISTVWRKLQEGGRGEARVGDWVVDEKWPEWSEEYVPSPQTP